MAFGHFVDVRQQDGQQVRMSYEHSLDARLYVEWIGIPEQMADKFRLNDSNGGL